LGDFPALRASEEDSGESGWWIAPESGMAAVTHDGWKARLDASPLGYGSMAAHGHGDALHLSLWDGPDALLIDPGTGGYFGMKEQRAKLAAWESHNGPQPVGGFRTPTRMGAFLWSEHHAKPELYTDGERRAQARLRHEGCDLARQVEIGEQGEVSVRDTVQGCAAFSVHWHFAPGCLISEAGPARWLVTRGDRRWRVDFQGDPPRCESLEGACSRRYGQFESHAILKVTAERFVVAVWSRVQ
jgi:hypothetical protein